MAGTTLDEMITRVSRLLADADPDAPNTRWPVDQLVDFINEAHLEILAYRSEAFSVTTHLPLAPGRIQRLSAEYLSVSSIDAHILEDGREVPVSEADFRYARTVRALALRMPARSGWVLASYSKHPIDDSVFFVEPDVPVGTEPRVRATVVMRPVRHSVNAVNAPLGIRPEFEAQVTDWVMWRALSMEQESPRAREAATQYRNMFVAALGEKYAARVRAHEGDEDVRDGYRAAPNLRK